MLLNPHRFGGPASGHRYWRIYITANNGDTYTGLTEIQFHSALGGPDLVPTITGISASVLYSSEFGSNFAYAVFDDNTSTRWFTSGGAAPHYIGYDFGSPKDIIEVSLFFDTPPATAARAPKDFDIQWSDDGSAWTTAYAATNETGWTTTPRVFSW